VTTGQDAQAVGVTVARIVRPHGRRGEVAAEILTDFPERLTRMKTALLWDGVAPARTVGVLSCRISPSRGVQAIFHFAGSDSITAAEKLVGLEVQIPASERMALPSGSYYVSELVGCEVRERGSLIGRVSEVQFTGGTPLLVVDSTRGEVLIPLAAEICVRIDTKARTIEVILPEGLRDLNQA
jgi:16S rRNA processing protein RimM